MTAVALYQWPAAAKFGRPIPKTKFYEHGNVSAAVRGKFVSHVQRITWSYKLAETTVNLLGSASVPEIQVFTIHVKGTTTAGVSDEVLSAIDRAVQFPIIFEISRAAGSELGTRMVAAEKTLGPKMQLSPYFGTDWLPPDVDRVPLPPALDLAGLYTALLTPILPVTVRPGEGLSEATGRISQAARLQREIASLEKKLRNEPQLNRKIELRRQLRERTQALADLTGPEPSTRG